MPEVRFGQPSNIAFDRFDHGRSERPNLGLGSTEQRTIRLRTATERLVEILAARHVDRPKHFRKAVERRQLAPEIHHRDEPAAGIQPIPAWVARKPPGDGSVGPHEGRARTL